MAGEYIILQCPQSSCGAWVWLLSETGRGSGWLSDVASYSDSCGSCPCSKGAHHSKSQQELSEAAVPDAPLVKNGTGREGTEILGVLI